MKVVKCLEHIPKLCWGKVIKNDMLAVLDTSEMDLLYYLKPSDTFPLPQQGDEIEVTATGKDTSWIDRFIYHGVADGIFVIKNKLGEPSCVKYIRPIEQASAAVGTSSTTCISEADETLLALRDIQKDLHEIFEYLKDN